MEMRLEFIWDNESGETKVTASSLETVLSAFEQEVPVDVLDFLLDVTHIAHAEYTDAIEGFKDRLSERAKQFNKGSNNG